MKELYEQYINRDNDLENNIEIIGEIIRANPTMLKYIQSKIDTCFGTHKVYVIHMRMLDTNLEMIKVGYTKNNVRERFGERRYAGRNNVELVEILRQEELQAKGAIDFEKHLKENIEEYRINTDITFPGKGEMYGIEWKDTILNLYDNTVDNYKDVYGFKSPN